MTDYVKIVNFAAKDALTTGNPTKVAKGTELGAELDAIATAVATKFDAGDIALIADGTAGAPGLAFNSDTDTGPYHISSGVIGISLNGTLSTQFYNGSLGTLDGTIGSPALSYINDSDTGLFRDTSNQIAVSLGGAKLGAFIGGHASAQYAPVLTGTGTVDFGSIGAGISAALSVAVTGAVVGDPVVVGTSITVLGLVPIGQVTSAGQVSVGFQNVTSGAIDPASCTFKVAVLKY